MSHIQQNYLILLRAAIFGMCDERFVITDEQELMPIVRLASFQGTGPLVFDQLLKMPELEIPADLRMQMKQQCLSSMMQQQVMYPILTQAWKALQQAGIHPVLLKGFGLAQYYPQPHLRQWGDMDVYVGQANYHKGCKVLRDAFPNIEHNEEENEDYKHYNFVFDSTLLEMHRVSMTFYHFTDRRYYEQLEAAYLTKDGPSMALNDLTVTLPEDTFNVFFVFLHAWHHFQETGMNMKQICDVAVLLHVKRDVIDRERLKEMLTKLQLMEVWQLFMYILVHYLGMSSDECPFCTEQCKERAELFFKRVLKEGSSRVHKKINVENVSYLKRKWITFQIRMADSRLVKPYAPKYARHMVISDILHGIERMIRGK